MIYSPVIIATLNRCEHLKRCLDSLDKNKGAEETEVYVSVDFPPSEKYWQGYDQVVEFLRCVQYRFKKFHVFFQEKNQGPKRNFEFLKRIVIEKSKTYIYTEDDNEFSPNFLQYVNKGLELFENDESVLAICGYKDTEWDCGGHEFTKSKLFPAYGYGAWFAKDELMYKEGQEILFSKNNLKIRNIGRLYALNKCLFYQYMTQVVCSDKGLFWNDGDFRWCDSAKSIYMHLTEKSVVVPLVPKSRTWGNDGSGLNMPDIMSEGKYELPILDERRNFEFILTGVLRHDDINYRLGDKYLRQCVSIKGLCVAWLEYILLILCGYKRSKAIKIVETLRRKNRIRNI